MIIAGSSEFSIHALRSAYICTDHHHVRISNDEPISYPDRKYNSIIIRQMSAEEEPRPIGLVPNKYSAIFVGVISIDYERHKPNCSSIASFDPEIQRVFIRHC